MSNGRKRGHLFTHPETGVEYVFDGARFVPVDSAAGLAIIGESAASEPRALDGSSEPRAPDGSEEQSGLAGFARTAAQGATFGLSDELAGLVARLPGGKTSEEATAAARQNLAQYRKAHPGMAIGAEVLGGLATGLLVPGGAARIIPTLGRGLRSARVGQRALSASGLGAAEGALYGAGSADEGGRIGGAVKGALAGGLLGGGIGAVMPASVGRVGGGRAPTAGGQALEAVQAARGGPRRAPARAPMPDPTDIPVTPIGQGAAPPSLLGRAQRGAAQSRVGQAVGRRVGQARQVATQARGGLGEAATGAREAIAQSGMGQRVGQALQTPAGQVVARGAQRVGQAGQDVGGLLQPLRPGMRAWGAEATERALQPITRAGSRRLTQLDNAHKAAARAFRNLDDKFQRGWSGKNRPGMSKAQLDAANRDVVRLVQDISEHPKAKKVLNRASGPFRDMTSIDNIRTIVRNADGTLKNPQSVRRLAHKEVKALWQNLRTMSGDIAEADVFFTKLDDAYRKLFGSGTNKATSGYKTSIQDLDSYSMGKGGPKNLAGRKMKRPELFRRKALRSPDGLRIAIKEISEHGGVGNTPRTLGNFMEGVFDTEVRQALTENPEAALKELAGKKEWLRMFFKPGKEGDKAFNGAWKEVQALAKDVGKRGGLSRITGSLSKVALMGASGAFVWSLFD